MPCVKHIINDPEVKKSMSSILAHNFASSLADGEVISEDAYRPVVVNLLKRNQNILNHISQTISQWGLDEHLEYLGCGENAIVFSIGDQYCLRLSVVRVSHYLENPEYQVPPPLNPPVLHKFFDFRDSNGEEVRVRAIISNRLYKTATESSLINSGRYFSTLQKAMSAYGYECDDRQPRNFMFADNPIGDGSLPYCMDYGVFLPKKDMSIEDLNALASKEVTIEHYGRNFTYKPGMHQEQWPILNLLTDDERLQAIKGSLDEHYHQTDTGVNSPRNTGMKRG